jgi:hypothetical protein
MNAATFIAVTLSTKENGISSTALGQGIFPAVILISYLDFQNYARDRNALTYTPVYSQMHSTWMKSREDPR